MDAVLVWDCWVVLGTEVGFPLREAEFAAQNQHLTPEEAKQMFR